MNSIVPAVMASFIISCFLYLIFQPSTFGTIKIESEPIEVLDGMPEHVHEVHLSDGTRCAVYSYGKQGGISCNWQNRAEADQ